MYDSLPYYVMQTSAGEVVLSVLVKGAGHYAVGEVEGLLNAVTVMDVNVDVEHAGMVPGW